MSHTNEPWIRTFGLIKPDAVRSGKTGGILDYLLKRELRITAMRMLTLTRGQAEWLYSHCRGRDYYEAQVHFMLSGPVVAFVLEAAGDFTRVGERYRMLLGATDPGEAHYATVRGRFGSVGVKRENAAHGSDSREAAEREIAHFFPELAGCTCQAITAADRTRHFRGCPKRDLCECEVCLKFYGADYRGHCMCDAGVTEDW